MLVGVPRNNSVAEQEGVVDTNRQSSVLIEWHDPRRLEPHPLNLLIYGEDGCQDLVGSIKEFGILEPLYVKNNTIISGHRRWRAAIGAGLTAVPCVKASYTDDLEERVAVIEHNRYRVKTGEQFYREGAELEKIEAERAKRRQVATLKQFQSQDTVVGNFPQRFAQGTSRDKVAQTIGLGSGRQWDKLEYVGKHAPELLPQIKPDGLSIHAAYKRAKAVNYNTPAVKPIDGGSTILIANEDALSFLKQSTDFASEISLAIVDPPYNLKEYEWDNLGSRDQYLSWLKDLLSGVCNTLHANYHLFLFCAPDYMADVEVSVLRPLGLPIRSRLVWHHRNLAMGRTGKFGFLQTYDLVFHCGTHPLNLSPEWDDRRFDVQVVAVPQTNFPADPKYMQGQKPIEIIRLFVSHASRKGDWVLDPTAGVGTTGIACQVENNRHCLLIEKDRERFNIILQRLPHARII